MSIQPALINFKGQCRDDELTDKVYSYCKEFWSAIENEWVFNHFETNRPPVKKDDRLADERNKRGADHTQTLQNSPIESRL